MFRLCYISTSREPIDAELCDGILRVSRRNNDRDGVTGLLIAGRHRFFQALEGEEGAVRRAFDRIRQDPRHFACVVIEDACRGIDTQGSLAKAWSDMKKAGVKRIQSGALTA